MTNEQAWVYAASIKPLVIYTINKMKKELAIDESYMGIDDLISEGLWNVSC